MIRLFQVFIALLLCSSSLFSAGEPAVAWPLKIEGARVPITLYQPQPETFKDDRLTGRAALSVHPEGKDPVFGTVWIEARVATDRDARTVTVQDVKVTRTRFVNATPEQEQTLSQLLSAALTQRNFVMSLDQLLVSMEAVEKEVKSAENLNMNPPKVYVEKSDALLVVLDGKPQLRPIEESSEMRMVNTPFLLVFTPSTKTYHLRAGERWLSATDLQGSWISDPAPPKLPKSFAPAEKPAESAKPATPTANAPPPKVIVSQEPAELIVSKGDPTYTPLVGSDLLYMSNTESNVFMESGTSKIYVLLSGRWFWAPKLEGPWTFVRPDALPAAFASIPKDSVKATVRASVAGTDEAKEAVVDAQIPQTAAISRKEADGKLKITWDGAPQFQEIEGLGVAYSLNASGPVFQVKNEGYWACDQGIWYTSKNTTGPWTVADRVPKQIYDIPPSCPYYNTKYVRVYEATPEVVYVGYYPGYVGSYPYYGTMVYGTGYYYSGWYGPTYYYPPPMMTWGYGYHYNPYVGWGMGGGAISIGIGIGIGGWYGPGYYPTPIPIRPINNRPRIEHHNRQNIYNNAQDRKNANTASGKTSKDRASAAKDNNVFADRDGNVHRQTKDGWQKKTGEGWASSDQTSGQRDLQRDSAARDRGAQRVSQSPAGGPMGGGRAGGGGRRR